MPATPQRPIGSGFGAQSTAADVLEGVDLTDALAVVTGGYSGSSGHRNSGIRFGDLMFERDEYEKWAAYGQAKSANSLFAVQLDALGQDAGVRAFALNPGGILTPLQRHLSEEEMEAMLAGIPDADTSLKTPQQGAATSTWAATSPALEGEGGVYCEDCEIAAAKRPDAQDAREGVSDHAIDPDAAARLWQVSARLTPVDAFG